MESETWFKSYAKHACILAVSLSSNGHRIRHMWSDLKNFRFLILFLSAALIVPNTLKSAPSKGKVDGNSSEWTLSCRIGPRLGLIFISVRSVSCEYYSPNGLILGRLTGSLSNIGVDLGIAGRQTIVWRVLSRDNMASLDSLNGEYAGSQGVYMMRHSTKGLSLDLVSLLDEFALGISAGQLGLRLSANAQSTR